VSRVLLLRMAEIIFAARLGVLFLHDKETSCFLAEQRFEILNCSHKAQEKATIAMIASVRNGWWTKECTMT
jgi:hypothetical protein